MQVYDVCIIGGGAAGLAAAVSLNNGINACIVEKNPGVGRKIRATGGGRCNITNEKCPGRDITREFFRKLGLEIYKDAEGRYYPYSGHAADVVRKLTDEAQRKGVKLLTGMKVSAVSSEHDRFRISAEGGECIYASYVLIACGGKAGPQFGTAGDGYAIVRSLGHTVTRLYPILTPLECGDLSDIAGIRAQGTVSLYRDGEKIAEEKGEIQFTSDGISGICVFNLTPYIKMESKGSFKEFLKRFSLKLDLAPDFTYEQIRSRKDTFGILSERLSARVGKDEIKNWVLPVKGVKGWKNAQCTGGGVPADETDMETMGSRIVPGLYLAGEILDIQGPCGGFNLQNAWETGIRAAEALNRRIV